MEGGGHNGRAPFVTALLFLCMFGVSLTLVQPPKEQACLHGEYLSEGGICCNKCPPGFRLVEECHAVGQRSICELCPDGEYMDRMNYFPNCFSCKHCQERKKEVEVSKCERNQNAICRCEHGYFKHAIDSIQSECRKCKTCGSNEKIKQTCTPENDTVCECEQNYYRVKRQCVPCQSCMADCKHHCPATSVNPAAPDNEKGFLINVIAAVVAVAVASLVLVVLVTHMATKRFTKNKLLRLSSRPSDVETIEALFENEEPSGNKSVKAVPQSPKECEISSLPDCVPPEVNTSDLIYMLLDLVPVLQVKQLARSLGVTDTAIERAELDHRSCKEAHYQMLRVWAEKGSQAGRGGHRRMVPLPLLQELLDKLRQMHLGSAAEELETKYSL